MKLFALGNRHRVTGSVGQERRVLDAGIKPTLRCLLLFPHRLFCQTCKNLAFSLFFTLKYFRLYRNTNIEFRRAPKYTVLFQGFCYCQRGRQCVYTRNTCILGEDSY